MQCRGERANGDVFLANVFFSTYEQRRGARPGRALWSWTLPGSAGRAETGLDELDGRVPHLVGAVSREVRNVCGAIGIVDRRQSWRPRIWTSDHREVLHGQRSS